MTTTKGIKNGLKSSQQKKSYTRDDLLSTGSTLLNLALTGDPAGGFIKGSYVLFVGDTDSGKTFLCLTCLAEACRNPNFDDYRLIYDNKERGALMDIEKFFGPKVLERLEPPSWKTPDERGFSETIEDLYFHLDDALDPSHGQPFIYIMDSIDSLSSDYEGKKFQEKKTARRKGTKAKGDYGDGKAKIHSGGIRRVLSGLERTGSIIIFINQTRDNIDSGLFESRNTHSGGRAISFYASMKLWSKVGRDLTRTYKNKKRQLGINARVTVERSRATGRRRQVDIPIYHSYGVDEIGSMIDYMVTEGDWVKSGEGEGISETTKINAPDFKFEGRKIDLVKHIEENDLESDLRDLVAETWRDIEKALVLKRRKRYE